MSKSSGNYRIVFKRMKSLRFRPLNLAFKAFNRRARVIFVFFSSSNGYLLMGKLILIAGASGSGKSQFASKLVSHILGRGTKVVDYSFDHYYHELSLLPVEERAKLNFDHPDSLDFTLARNHLKDGLQGNHFELPQYCFETHTRKATGIPISPAPLFVFEGILALHDGGIRQLAEISIFIETSLELCLERRIQRDVRERGRTKASVIKQWQNQVLPMYEQFVLPSKTTADIIISGEHPFETQLEKLQSALEFIP